MANHDKNLCKDKSSIYEIPFNIYGAIRFVNAPQINTLIRNIILPYTAAFSTD